MDKNNKQIMVIEHKQLFSIGHFEGFESSKDYAKIIESHFQHMKRGDIEYDFNYKQPVGYIIIVNKNLKKVFAYQRATHNDNYREMRLQGKWSLGVGGHVDKEDGLGMAAVKASVLRELAEEVNCKITGLKHIGYINYENNSIGKAHFGLLYIAETDDSNVTPKDKEMSHGGLKNISEIETISKTQDTEEWSLIALNAVKKYLND